MNFYKENMHVVVDSVFGKGTGIIRHVSDFFFCPVQVELDKPNEDGHKMVRFKFDEIKPLEFLQPVECLWDSDSTQVEPEEIQEIPEVEPEEEIVELEEEPIIVNDNPPIDKVVRMIKKCNGYSFNVGDTFKASGTGSKYDTCYYLYDMKSGKKLGCILKEFFKELQESEIDACEVEEHLNINTPKEPETIEIEEPEQPKVEPVEDDVMKKVEKRIAKLKDTFGKKKPKTVQDALELKGQVTLFDLL